VGPDATVAATVPDQDAWLWQQVRALPARQAQAIALAYVEDLPLERVAAILGCAETTVKTHLARGRQTLARAIEQRDATALADREPDATTRTTAAVPIDARPASVAPPPHAAPPSAVEAAPVPVVEPRDTPRRRTTPRSEVPR
jgi:predicted DNA-binding protein (UPF0251 family)